MEINEKQQEMMFKFQMYEQEIQQINQQLQAIEQAIQDMKSIDQGLEEIKGSEGKEILAPVGRGIFVKAKVLSEDLTVDVGNKTFVKKNVEDTKNIITDQIERLEEIQEQLHSRLEEINSELTRIIMESQNSGDSGCSCEECNCEDSKESCGCC